jgi:hypothetical protein
MDFLDNLTDVFLVDEEVALFEASKLGYYAYLRRGGRLDIRQVFTCQPPIDDFNDYFSYMFVESLQGFFLLRHRMLENKPQPWTVFLALKPAEPLLLFRQAYEFSRELRRRHESPPAAGEQQAPRDSAIPDNHNC